MQIVRLLLLIFTQGKLHYESRDYNSLRRKLLAEIPELSPSRKVKSESKLKEWLMRKRYLRPWVAEAVWIRNALRLKGGHLSAGSSNICYIRIPKCASTALSWSILRHHFPQLSNYNLSPERINYLTDLHLVEYPRTGENDTTFFTVVRNPFSRIVSVYRSFFEAGTGDFIYDDYLFGILGKHLSFKEFVQRVALIPDLLKDQHLKPQHFFLRVYEKKNVNLTVLKLEEAEKIQAFLSGFGLTFASINQSAEPYDYRLYYDPCTLETVYRIYAADISRFGYGKVYDGLRGFVFKTEQ